VQPVAVGELIAAGFQGDGRAVVLAGEVGEHGERFLGLCPLWGGGRFALGVLPDRDSDLRREGAVVLAGDRLELGSELGLDHGVSGYAAGRYFVLLHKATLAPGRTTACNAKERGLECCHSVATHSAALTSETTKAPR
jgi:hypothetical protein